MRMPEWITKYWIQELFGLIITGLSIGYARLGKKLKKERNKNQAIENGLTGILRIQIIDTYEKCISDGKISLSRKDAIGDVYRSYVALCESRDDVDDAIKQIYGEITRLPII